MSARVDRHLVASFDALADHLAERIADRVAEQIANQLAHPLPAPELLSAEQAGAVLGISKTKVQRLIVSGELPAVRIDRRVLIRRSELNAFISLRPPA